MDPDISDGGPVVPGGNMESENWKWLAVNITTKTQITPLKNTQQTFNLQITRTVAKMIVFVPYYIYY